MKINFLEFFKTFYKEDYKIFTQTRCPVFILDEKIAEIEYDKENHTEEYEKYVKMRDKTMDLGRFRFPSGETIHRITWNIQSHMLTISKFLFAKYSGYKNAYTIPELNDLLTRFCDNVLDIAYCFNKLKKTLEKKEGNRIDE